MHIDGRRAQLFCPECATPLFAMALENATSVIIRLGCVKQRAQLVPAVHSGSALQCPGCRTYTALPPRLSSKASFLRC
jgi:hypothetical protein